MKRRRRLCAGAASAVLLNDHLLSTISGYQQGLYEELVPIYREWAAMQNEDGQFLFLIDQYLLYMDPVSLQKLHVHTKHPRFLLHLAIVQGQMPLLSRWLRCVGTAWINHDTMNCAARHGQLEIVTYLATSTRLRCSADAMAYAAANGHLDVVKYFYAIDPGLATPYALHQAAEYGHLHVVAFFARRCPHAFARGAMDYAAANGHLAVVRYLHETQSDASVCSTNAMDFAAANGHLDVVKFLHQARDEGCTWNAMDEAATNGYLAVVVFLHQHRKEGCSREAIRGAAGNGHDDIVAYLRDHGLGCSPRDAWKTYTYDVTEDGVALSGEAWPSIEDSLDFLMDSLTR
ncbi:hypothetical protein SDRG_07101 [Saprolegnia diclina VS20]|uniref:Uncharacterized protein n=1 Tax=Saprolegnia diclina (strain VS20) TaxID=1156394 RepID=T0QNI8_SAPDV|nr:hypothetical protein SDRG_07101 [Saprolegnia diclina VS20]EQC35390.1 hypothetical protein SDRG_07101 [Saprolegnia diclina VS20]|eukprot:XP_008611140.1 hypothetical protein SDRG_07101 [Saprolegnia diclina VS20]